MEDISGKKYGFLTAIKFSHYRKTPSRKTIYWEYKCDCGNFIIRAKGDVSKGNIVSCGCKTKELHNIKIKIHGLSNTSLYDVHRLMLRRCFNKKIKAYKNYGGRGITVCEEWKNDFMAFYNWAISNGYKEGLTIDRIDVNGNYEPNNCRWVTREEQANNKRNNHYIFYKGEKHTLADWCKILKLNYNTTRGRFNNYHYTPEEAFELKRGGKRCFMPKANFKGQLLNI